MKRLIIILFFTAIFFKSLNAVEKNENALDSMLQNNFKLYLKEKRQVDSTYCAHLNKYNKIEYPAVYEYIKSVYFSKFGYPHGFEFRDTINGMKAHYVDLMDYMSLEQTLRKPKPVMSLHSMKIEKNDIYFDYMLSTTTLKNKYGFSRELYAWFYCHYRYDCNLKRWILFELKLNYI